MAAENKWRLVAMGWGAGTGTPPPNQLKTNGEMSSDGGSVLVNIGILLWYRDRYFSTDTIMILYMPAGPWCPVSVCSEIIKLM